MPHLVAAPDKFRGTASAAALANVMADAARAAGWSAETVPISDGGEGLLDCFGGANRTTRVDGPLGAPIEAGWRLDGTAAVVEMAAASGIELVAGRNDPVAASTRGTGQLIRAAIDSGATEIIVGAGGSASTDGGAAAVEILREHAPLTGRVIVAADVRTGFLDAAVTFAPQKGADAEQVRLLTARLQELADQYRSEFGVDVTSLVGAGAAGGLAGGLAALGAEIRPGFDIVAQRLNLPTVVERANLVITGEGRLDETTLAGKAVGGLAELCTRSAVRLVAVAGQVASGFSPPFPVFDLSATFGPGRAYTDTLSCVREAVESVLAGLST